MKVGSNLEKEKEYVFYCPECDGIHVRKGDNAYVFEGPLILLVCKDFSIHKFYLIGEL